MHFSCIHQGSAPSASRPSNSVLVVLTLPSSAGFAFRKHFQQYAVWQPTNSPFSRLRPQNRPPLSSTSLLHTLHAAPAGIHPTFVVASLSAASFSLSLALRSSASFFFSFSTSRSCFSSCRRKTSMVRFRSEPFFGVLDLDRERSSSVGSSVSETLQVPSFPLMVTSVALGSALKTTCKMELQKVSSRRRWNGSGQSQTGQHQYRLAGAPLAAVMNDSRSKV
mmetsp:Transcript_728/g.1631  ORF Transcript_728/g.1631 Transcript_728/m.1631 type:complete len:222 (+) Transcript_728:218-883(+)